MREVTTSSPCTVARSEGRPGLDLLRVPLLGPFLRWRRARLLCQLVLLVGAAVLVLHGLFGSQLAPKNLATLLVWVHWRGLLVPTGLVSRRLLGVRESLGSHVARYAFALVPLGVGVWLAHYSFHLLTGLWTFVPVAQSAAAESGVAWLGRPDWGLGGLPADKVWPIELGFLVLGLCGSLAVAWRLGRDRARRRAAPGLVPWAALLALLFAAAVWLMRQPMEMRGTFL